MLSRGADIWTTLDRFVRFVNNLYDHFKLEKEVIFSELDKIPRKFPLKFKDMGADDWGRIFSAAKNIAKAVEYKDEKLKSSAISSARTYFMREHLEEKVVFPMIEKLTEEQRRGIICVLTEASEIPWRM